MGETQFLVAYDIAGRRRIGWLQSSAIDASCEIWGVRDLNGKRSMEWLSLAECDSSCRFLTRSDLAATRSVAWTDESPSVAIYEAPNTPSVFVDPFLGSIANVNWSTYNQGATFFYGGAAASTIAQNSSITYEFDADAGVYTLDLLLSNSTNRGVYTITLDGVDLATKIDGYSSTATVPRATIANVRLTQSGTHTLKFTMVDKDAASTGYEGCLLVERWSTADEGVTFVQDAVIDEASEPGIQAFARPYPIEGGGSPWKAAYVRYTKYGSGIGDPGGYTHWAGDLIVTDQ